MQGLNFGRRMRPAAVIFLLLEFSRHPNESLKVSQV